MPACYLFLDSFLLNIAMSKPWSVLQPVLQQDQTSYKIYFSFEFYRVEKKMPLKNSIVSLSSLYSAEIFYDTEDNSVFSNHLKTPSISLMWTLRTLEQIFEWTAGISIQYQLSSPLGLHKVQLQSFWQHSPTYSSMQNCRVRLEKKKRTGGTI